MSSQPDGTHIDIPDGVGEHLELGSVQTIITAHLLRPGTRKVSVEQKAPAHTTWD